MGPVRTGPFHDAGSALKEPGRGHPLGQSPRIALSRRRPGQRLLPEQPACHSERHPGEQTYGSQCITEAPPTRVAGFSKAGRGGRTPQDTRNQEGATASPPGGMVEGPHSPKAKGGPTRPRRATSGRQAEVDAHQKGRDCAPIPSAAQRSAVQPTRRIPTTQPEGRTRQQGNGPQDEYQLGMEVGRVSSGIRGGPGGSAGRGEGDKSEPLRIGSTPDAHGRQTPKQDRREGHDDPRGGLIGLEKPKHAQR